MSSVSVQQSVGRDVSLSCADGWVLRGSLWTATAPKSSIIVAGATGAPAAFYASYAKFLSQHGHDVLTFDYRGVGRSRPPSLRGCDAKWRDWGEQDLEAAISFMKNRSPSRPVQIVGHSIGGVLPGLAPSGGAVERLLSVGGQFGWWGDYAIGQRFPLALKWHVAMPILTLAFGYFPGQQLGWMEDLPAGVAMEWARRQSRFEFSHPAKDRAEVKARMASFRGKILAVVVSDDPIGTCTAVRRGLAGFTRARTEIHLLRPQDVGADAVGHLGLFRRQHQETFWRWSLGWLTGE